MKHNIRTYDLTKNNEMYVVKVTMHSGKEERKFIHSNYNLAVEVAEDTAKTYWRSVARVEIVKETLLKQIVIDIEKE